MAKIMNKLIIMTIFVALIFTGCRKPLEPVTVDFVEYGWELYGAGDYNGAIEQFEDGVELSVNYTDGHNGIGWAYIMLNYADTSETYFSTGAAVGDTSIVGTEILAGRAFARLAQSEYVDAIIDAKAALNRTPTWIFRHDSSMTHHDLTHSVATAFYAQGLFDSSYVWVRKLDATFTTDVTTLGGRSKLAAKLEELDSIF